MTKYSVKNYAVALAGLMASSHLSDKKVIHPVKSAKGGVALSEQQFNWASNFLKLLEKNRDLKNAKKIITLAQKYFLERKGNKSIILETARKTELKSVLRSLLKEGDIVEEKSNPELIAGIKIIIGNEKQLDFSLSKKLEQVFK